MHDQRLFVVISTNASFDFGDRGVQLGYGKMGGWVGLWRDGWEMPYLVSSIVKIPAPYCSRHVLVP
jgi:hypothetical protein